MSRILARGARIAPGFLLGRAALARQGDARVLVIRGGEVRAPLVLARAQAAGVEATGFDSVTWRSFGADLPRFVAPEVRLLIEGQRTNQVRNPRAEGAAAGVFPTNWGGTVLNVGITASPTGAPFDIGGVRCIDLAYSGTTSGSYNVVQSFDTNAMAAATGTVVTASVFAALTAGAFPAGSTVEFTIREHDSGDVFLRQTLFSLAGLTGTLQRIAGTATTGASTATVRVGLRVTIPTATATSFTLRLGFPQLELGAFASTPILPPVGTPGASTRGTDILTAPLSSLGIADNGACTVLWRGVIPQEAPATLNQTIFQIDDNSSSNRFLVYNSGPGAGITSGRLIGGAASLVSVGTMTPGTEFRVGASIDGAGRIAASLDGSAAVVRTGGPTGGLTTFRLGNVSAANAALFGETHTLTVLPRVLSDADLQAAVAAL